MAGLGERFSGLASPGALTWWDRRTQDQRAAWPPAPDPRRLGVGWGIRRPRARHGTEVCAHRCKEGHRWPWSACATSLMTSTPPSTSTPSVSALPSMPTPSQGSRSSRDGLRLLLNTATGPGGAAQPMPDGREPEPGGWNRVQLEVTDLDREVEALREAGCRFRNSVVTGRGGKQILLDDPGRQSHRAVRTTAHRTPTRSDVVGVSRAAPTWCDAVGEPGSSDNATGRLSSVVGARRSPTAW